MNSRILSRCLLVASVLGVAACGDDPADLVRRTLSEFDRVAVGTCRCAPTVSMETVSEAECLSGFREDLPSESETQCIERAFDGATDSDIAATECQADAISTYADCTERAPCTAEAITACQDAYEAEEGRCADVSDALETRTEACFPEEEEPPPGI